MNIDNAYQDKSSKIIWTVPLYFLLCMYFFGSIMMTHFVIYSHFDKVHDNFQTYMGVFNYKMIFFCYFPAILMLISSVLLWFNCPKEFPRWTVLTSIILGLVSVATTFFAIIPLHKALQTLGFNAITYDHLVSISLTFQIIPILFQVLISVWLLTIYLKDTKLFARWLFIIICLLNFYTQATGWTESFVAYPMWAEVSKSDWLTFRGGDAGFVIFVLIFLIPGFLPMLLMPFLFWFRPKGIPKFYVVIYVIAFLWLFGITATYFIPSLQTPLDTIYSPKLIEELRRNDLLLRFPVGLILFLLPSWMLVKVGQHKMKETLA
jgi:hypothetical protein